MYVKRHPSKKGTITTGSVAVAGGVNNGARQVTLLINGNDPLSGLFAVANVTMSIDEAEAHIEAVRRAIASTKEG